MKTLVDYAMSFVGVPYRWGGENPISGFDCSGLVQEILRSAGMDPPGDQTAQALYNYFASNAQGNPRCAGALAFYGKSHDKITHVAFMIDEYRIIEAGGGGSITLTKEDAALQNAFVRVRLLRYRSDFLCTIKPNYALIGVK